ncbi:hypothetical protein BGY98DRAFT_936427 [Russula aff. rugulosa BPL654]|nr:hypothetical protein BGY98DRAFT_936427 [Russula aff. rugulosa BPL654]
MVLLYYARWRMRPTGWPVFVVEKRLGGLSEGEIADAARPLALVFNLLYGETVQETKGQTSFEPTLLLAAASALLGRLGISLLDDLRESPPDILARHQAMLQPPNKLLMYLLRFSAAFTGVMLGISKSFVVQASSSSTLLLTQLPPHPTGNEFPARAGGKCPVYSGLLTLDVAATEPGPFIGVPYRLGCQGIHLEERLTSASCEYEGTWKKQEWNLHGADMGQRALRTFCGTGRILLGPHYLRWVLYGTEVWMALGIGVTRLWKTRLRIMEDVSSFSPEPPHYSTSAVGSVGGFWSESARSPAPAASAHNQAHQKNFGTMKRGQSDNKEGHGSTISLKEVEG